MGELEMALIGAAAQIIVGILTLVGVVIANKNANDKMNTELHQQLQTSQAVTETKLEELTREVREHNGFARRMPVVEEKIRNINHKIEEIEKDFYSMN